MPVNIGNGTTITHAQLSGNVISAEPGGNTANEIDSSHLGTVGVRPGIADTIWDADDIAVTVQFDPGTKPVVGGDASAFVVTFPDLETWSCSAWLKTYSPSVRKGEMMEATFTFRRTTDWS